MIPHVSFSSLTSSRQRLLRLMQDICFGRIEGLVIKAGQPVLDPRPKVIREIKLDSERPALRDRHDADFCLKQQVVNLFAFFDQRPDAVISVLEIKDGLPFRMVVEDVA